MTALLAVAGPAVDRLLAAAETAPEADRGGILRTAKRMGYNVAADVWPGWDIETPPRSAAELAAALDLARKSSAIVDRLDQGPMQRGNAAWLVAALELAQGDRPAATGGFRRAAQLFDAPEMRLMAEGYGAISGGSDNLVAVIASLEAIGSEDALDMRKQLATASAIFGASAKEGGHG